ncbi:hypothetical protein JTB14_007943 [Gonioctena quinquepunctata]|nr:hypothetical protein JTB14_007943 [Gonioctena quinquepunctata]
MLFGLTCDDVRKLAHQLAVINNICHRFIVANGRAGWYWLRGFRQRNPKISLRNPEPTSADEMVEKHKIDPLRFRNVDETGMSTVQRPQKVFAKKAISGNKKYLRFDGDHEKLLTCLELSDIEGCVNEDDDSENENGNADGIRE